jgi:hypothetical protein
MKAEKVRLLHLSPVDSKRNKYSTRFATIGTDLGIVTTFKGLL